MNFVITSSLIIRQAKFVKITNNDENGNKHITNDDSENIDEDRKKRQRGQIVS